MKIWVDADACPGEIKDVVIRAATRLNLQAVFVANKNISLPRFPNLLAVKVDKGPDVADGFIGREAASGDIAITADVPLAAILVQKNIAVINPRGEEYNAGNIGERLSVRDFMDGLRGSGLITGGPKQFDAKAKQKFASALDRLLTKALKS